jgi:hypothetical protein
MAEYGVENGPAGGGETSVKGEYTGGGTTGSAGSAGSPASPLSAIFITGGRSEDRCDHRTGSSASTAPPKSTEKASAKASFRRPCWSGVITALGDTPVSICPEGKA